METTLKSPQLLPALTPRTAIERQISLFEAKLGISVRFVADEKFTEKTGIQPFRLWSLRAGKATAKPKELKALADFFGCSTDDLI